MAAQGFSEVIPYAVNTTIVVAFLAVVLRKPTRKFLYQRHERMKDVFEVASRQFSVAQERNATAKNMLASLTTGADAFFSKEKALAEKEKAELLESAHSEATRIAKETDRLVAVEGDDALDKVRETFIEMVVGATEENLRKGLKGDDHSAIVKRAQNSIEVGV